MSRYLSGGARLAAVAVIALGVIGVGPVFGDDDDKKKNNSGEGVAECTNDHDNNCAGRPQGSQDTIHTNGQVMQINSLKEPPELILANVDGLVTVKLVGKEGPYLIKSSGVRLGEHIEVWGNKISEVEFEADSIARGNDNH